MTKKSFAWFFMTLLAVAVAAYAIAIVADRTARGGD